MLHSRCLCLMMVVLGLQACAPSLRRPAPVEDRGGAPTRPMPSGTASASATEPGTYVVQRGDTLAKIALDHGVSWRDVARWNQLENPNVIEVGQVLRIQGPTEPMSVRPLAARPLPAAPNNRPVTSAA